MDAQNMVDLQLYKDFVLGFGNSKIEFAQSTVNDLQLIINYFIFGKHYGLYELRYTEITSGNKIFIVISLRG